MAYNEDVNVNLNVLTGTMGGITAIMGGMSALTSSFGALGTTAAESFGTLDGLLVTSTALISTFAIQSAEAFGQYEQGMKVVQTVSGQTSYAMNELSNRANEMSIAYRTSINDITDGLQTLGRAGLNSVNEQLEVLESGLQTAKLEGRNLNGVLEEIIQNTAMLGGDLKSVNFGEQAEYLNSLMVGTSMTAPITSHDISQTLQYAGGTAAAAGANLETEGGEERIEDLMGTIAAFAQKGVKGSMAGTALRAFFTKPASQDESVVNALSSIGLDPSDLWENGGESMKKVSDQVGIIQNRMDSLNMSTMDQVELWGKLVGPKMGQQMMKLDSSSIKELTRDIQSANSAEELAQQTLYTYTQQLSEMQQQGDLAFREFGAKVVQFLQPAAWAITQILGLLSDPHINLYIFAAVGSLLSHGFQKAWAMAKTFFAEIKGLLTQTASAIQNINTLAGGGSSGFAQTSSQVDFLNRKLHETDATLQAIQAKSMGIKPGYIMPGDHGLQAVPRGTLKAYKEDVVIDKAGVMGGKVGQVYPGQYAEQFKTNIKKEIAATEEQHKQLKVNAEKEIAALQTKKANAEAVADQTHLERLEMAKNIVREEVALLKNSATTITWRNYGLDPIAQKQMLTDKEVMAAIKTHGMVGAQEMGYFLPYQQESVDRGMTEKKWLQSEYDKRLAPLATQSASQRRRWLGDVQRGYDSQINSIKEEVALSEKGIGMKKEQLKALEQQGITKVQTRMDMMTTKQFNQWYKNLDESDAMQKYSKMRTDEMFAKHGNLIAQYEKQGYLPAFVSRGIPDSHPNRSILEQAHNTGATQAWIDADKARIAQQKALWAGEASMTKRAQNFATQRMNAWGNAMNKGINAMTSIPSRIKNIPNQIAMFQRDPGAYLKANASAISRDAAALSLDKLKLSGMSAAQAMDVVAKELGLTKTELSMVLADETKLAEVSRLSGQELAQLTTAARLLKQTIIEGTVTENMDEEAEKRHAVVVEEDIASLSQHAIATKMTSSTMGGIRGAITNFGSSIKSAASTVVGYMGGPLMAAMMAFTFITQQINEQQQKWQEKIQEATDQLSEASDSIAQSSEKLKEIYETEYSNMSDADIEKITDYQYAAIMEAYDTKGTKAKFSDMYNNEIVKVENLSWTSEERDQYKIKTAEELEELNANAETVSLTGEENIKALEENTVSLKSAAAQYAQALQKVANAGNDDRWGFAGTFTNMSDATGDIKKGNFLNTGIIPEIKQWLTQSNEGFLDNNEPVLTESQRDKNYSFGTDFASVFLANSYRFDVEDGLQRFFGNDYDRIISIMGGINNQMRVQTTQFGEFTGPANLLGQYANYFATMPQSDVSLALAFMKDNPEDMSKLGKQIFRQEQQYDFKPGITASGNYGAIKAGYHPSGQPLQVSKTKSGATLLGTKDIKSLTSNISKAKLTVQDQNLKATVNKFREMTGNKLSEQTILMMGNLQMLSDMNKVAQEQVAPGITQTVQTAGQIMNGTFEAAGYAGSASTGAGGAAANAYAIAVFLQAQAQESSTHAQYEKYLRDPNAERSWFGFGGLYDEKEFNNMISQKGSPMYEKYGKPALEQAAIATSMLTQPGRTYEEHLAAGKRSLQKVEEESNKYGTNFQDMMNTVTRGMPEVLQKQVMSAYDQSNIGEYGSGSGSGGGGSGGGGSGKGSGSDSGSGTRKERVDLVLCNKKEIPKLNVNLFKKPPNFTILNKNFKLRDIKINSQDKPKAIMNAIKNGIIETQKRMDPKIIQDDVAEFDPVSATEGNSVPKGNTKTTT